MLGASLIFMLASAAAAAADAGWATYLAFPNITSIETTLTTGDERFLEVRYNGEDNLQTFEIKPDLTLDGVVLPEGLRKLTLTRLNLAAIPDGIQWPSTLQSIDLSSNALTGVPANSQWPAALTSLSLARNKLSACVANLPASVASLDLGENQVSCIRACQWPASLETLTLSGNPLKVLSLKQKWPTQLKELHMDNTQLQHVPSTFPNGLQQLHLNYNKIAAFPRVLPPSLEFLSLSFNSIKALPASINRFPNLGVLQLANNQLTSLPANLALPKGFRILRLSNNKLTTLPATSNAWLTQIEVSIMLDGNQLTALPAQAKFPPETDLANNKLTVLENLALPKHFNINDNPLERVARVSVVDGSFWRTSPATLKSFTLDEKAFATLETLLGGYGFFNLRWSVDADSAAVACKADNGVLKPLKDGDLSVCVVPGGY